MPTVRTYRQAAAWCAAALLVLSLSIPVAAQENRADRLRSDRLANPFENLQGQADVTQGLLALEGAVDPDAYHVGPGDLFSVYIGGSQPITLTQAVSADGRLVLPEVPGLPVAGKTLAVVQDEARAALRQRFQNVTLDIALVQPRQFFVHVTGAVPQTGRFMATPVMRVSTVLAQAFADTLRRPVDNPDYAPSLRTVTVRHRDGTKDSVDLRRYFATGNTEYDPFLSDGDVVSVPAYHVKQEAVFVDGAVPFPGSYAHRPGDTVLDLLALATGSEDAGSVHAVRLTRNGPDGPTTTEAFDLAQLRSGAVEAPHLEPLDHVHVPANQTQRGAVTVAGAVERPGTYPITIGETSLQDVMHLVELRPDALVRAAYLERSPLRAAAEQRFRSTRYDRLGMTGQRDPTRLLSIRADSAAVLRATRLSDFEFTTRSFLQQEMRLQNRVSLDLPAVLSGSAGPVLLRDGDRLVVPRDEQTVYVFGQVNRPGYVAYQPEWAPEEYIQFVGGLGLEATNAYVIKSGTGRYVRLRDAEVDSGDMIFVDRKGAMANTPEMQRLLLEERRTSANDRFRRVQAIVQTVSAIATIITTYVAVRKL